MTPQDPTRATLSLLSGDRHAAGNASDLLSAALESLSVGIVVSDQNGTILLVNREIERAFGYDQNELIGQSIRVLLPDDAHSPPDQDAFAESRATRVERETFGRRKDGSEIAVDVGLTPIRLRDAEFVITTAVDITERRGRYTRLQEELDERLGFESLVSELGAQFVFLRAIEVDAAIVDALGRLARTLGLDRGAVFQIDHAGDFVHTHQWTRPGWAPLPPRLAAQKQLPWHLAQLRASQVVTFGTLDEISERTDRDTLRHVGTKAGLTAPLTISGEVWGGVTFASVRQPRSWTTAETNRLGVAAHILGNALAGKSADERLRQAMDTVSARCDRLRHENEYLRTELKTFMGTPPLVGHSPVIRQVLAQVRQVAPTDAAVLLTGEPGTGKALLATQIHELSARSEHAMVRVSCASLSSARMESELVGSERGSYAEPQFRHLGRLELAHGSTVYLDEVANLSLEAQDSLIRVLADKQVVPLGGSRAVPVDVRVIAATRQDLRRSIEDGVFREDLYRKLTGHSIHVPALRERPEDIPLLVWRFVDEFARAFGKPIDAIDEASMAALRAYPWPGNARELRNIVERAMIIAAGRRLEIPVPRRTSGASRRSATLAAVEREHISSVLAACGGQVQGRHGAAARLGLTPRSLAAKMKALGLRYSRSSA